MASHYTYALFMGCAEERLFCIKLFIEWKLSLYSIMHIGQPYDYLINTLELKDFTTNILLTNRVHILQNM